MLWGLAVPWQTVHEVTGVLVDVTILLAAVGAVVKFRLLNMFGHRWRSELICAHWQLRDGSYVFTADYILHNTGPRSLHLERVTLRLVPAKSADQLLVPSENGVLAERTLAPTDPALRGLFHIESGERTIFTLRCRLQELPECAFILCAFDLKQRRVPAAFRGFYCTAQHSADTGTTEPTRR
jgi:hypothetical protein